MVSKSTIVYLTAKHVLFLKVIQFSGSPQLPYHCYFCEMQLDQYELGIRHREPILVEEEVEYLKRDYGIEGISLLDEIGIPLNRKKAILYLEALGRTNIKWRAQCRVDNVTSELAKLAQDAGCVTMALGVESASQQALDIINKKIEVDKARESIHNLKKSGIETRIYMICGLNSGVHV